MKSDDTKYEGKTTKNLIQLIKGNETLFKKELAIEIANTSSALAVVETVRRQRDRADKSLELVRVASRALLDTKYPSTFRKNGAYTQATPEQQYCRVGDCELISVAVETPQYTKEQLEEINALNVLYQLADS